MVKQESSWVVVDRLKKNKSILEKFKINFKLIDSTSITKTRAIIKMQRWIFNSGMKYSFEICKEHRHKTILSPLQGKEMAGKEMIDPFSIFKNKEKKPNASKKITSISDYIQREHGQKKINSPYLKKIRQIVGTKEFTSRSYYI